MSDVSFAKAGWFLRTIFFIALGIVWLYECLPVVISRREYKRLRDNDHVIEHAHEIIRNKQKENENGRIEDCE